MSLTGGSHTHLAHWGAFTPEVGDGEVTAVLAAGARDPLRNVSVSFGPATGCSAETCGFPGPLRVS